MITPITLRMATEDDAPDLAEIYAPIVRDTAISFELDPPCADEMKRRLRAIHEVAPWIVAAEDGRCLGYAYARRFRERAAYAWSAETTVYVAREARRRGVGRALYVALLEGLTHQGYRKVLALITLPNDASVGLHESLGFRPAGVLHEVGFKHGEWHDVGTWERELGVRSTSPRPPSHPSCLDDDSRWRHALESAGRAISGARAP